MASYPDIWFFFGCSHYISFLPCIPDDHLQLLLHIPYITYCIDLFFIAFNATPGASSAVWRLWSNMATFLFNVLGMATRLQWWLEFQMSPMYSPVLASRPQPFKWGSLFEICLDFLYFCPDIELCITYHDILSWVPICTTYSRNYSIFSAMWIGSFSCFQYWCRLLVFPYLYNFLVISADSEWGR